MGQRIGNIYRLVTIPAIYEAIQKTLMPSDGRSRFVDEMIRAEPGMKMLDVGCGPASVLAYLPDVDCTGIDLNEKHVLAAREKFGTRGRFLVGDSSLVAGQEAGTFDLILVSALLHHISDAEGTALFVSLESLLKPDGRIVTIDNVWLPRQRWIAKLLNKLDSGLNIRTPAEYERLLDRSGLRAESRIFHDLLAVPYDHFCMTLTRQGDLKV